MSETQTSHIQLHVELDVNKVPQSITWDAEQTGVVNKPASAVILSVWDAAEENTLRMDLWTKDMTVDEMKKFIHQNILLMADTLQRATGEVTMAETMRDFGAYYAEKLNLLAPGQG